MFGLTYVNGMPSTYIDFILIGQSQSMEDAVNTRKSRRVGSDVQFRDGDSTITTAVSRAEARLDRTRTEVMTYAHVMR